MFIITLKRVFFVTYILNITPLLFSDIRVLYNLSVMDQQEVPNTPIGECFQDIDLYKQHPLLGYHLFDVYISPEYPTECFKCMKG